MIEELEARILLSTWTLQNPDQDAAAEEQELSADEVARTLSASESSAPSTFDDADALDDANSRAAVDVRRELVFIDEGVDDYDQLLNDLMANADEGREFEVLLLSNARDGIEQITEALADHQGLDAIHIISHGSDGSIELGNTSLNAETLENHDLKIALWANSFAETGDILIYGCNLAETEVGKSLVSELSELTLTDVAASDDVTGSVAQGGDWNLEYASGSIEASTVLDDGVSLEEALGVVSIEEPWTNLAVSTDRSTTISENHTVTAAPGSDRLLLVTMVTRFGFDQTIDVTSATFGGVQLHEIVEGSSDATRNGVWMGYLLDSEIPDGEQSLSVSFTSTVSDPTGTKLLAATYAGVDQTTPVNDSSANNTKADAPITFGSQIDHAAGAEVVYVASYGGNTNTNTTEPAGFSKIYTNEWSGLLMTTISHMDDTSTAGSSLASTAVDFEGTDANHSLAVVALNATPTNSIPTAADNTVTTDEDTDYVFSAGDFNFSDVDAGDALQQVKITSLPGNGTLRLSGADVTLNQVIAVADIDADNLTFTPAAEQSGSGYDNFDFKVSDGESIGSAGTVLNSFPAGAVVNSMSGLAFDGTGLWLTSPNTDTIYNYDTAGNLVTSFAAPGTYPTGITFDGTNLWVVDRDDNMIYEIDTLGIVQSSFATPGTDSRGLTWDGSSLWLVEGTGSTIYELSTAGTVLSSFAWPDDYMRDITWDGSSLWVADSNDSQIIEIDTSGTVLSSFASPSTGATGFTFDGNEFWHADADTDTVYQLSSSTSTEYSTSSYTMTIDVISVNDPAVISGDTSYTGNEGDAVAGDLNATDVEGLTDTTYFTVSSGATNGTAVIDAETGAWSFTPTDSKWFGTDSFEVTVTDDVGGTTTQLISITLAKVNDAPVANDDSYSVDEDQTLTVSATPTPPSTGYNFDEGSGQTITDSSGNGADGTLGSSSGAASDDPTWTTSSRTGGSALQFDGSDDYVQTTSTDLQTATNFTLSAWFKADTTTGQQHILWQGIGTEQGWGDPGGTALTSSEMHLTVGHWSSPDNISFFLGWDEADPESIDIISSRSFTDTTQWHHAAVVVTDIGGGSVQADLYVDGVLEGSDTGSQIDRSNWDTDLRIGAPGASSRFFDGTIDEVGIWTEPLAPTQITEMWKAGVTANDTDEDNDALSASVVTGPDNGVLNLNTDGSFEYTPDDDFSGVDTFTYLVNDGTVNSNVATVTITVNPQDDAAVITGDLGFSGNEGDVVAGDLDATDIEGLTDTTYFSVTSDATNGTAAIHAETGAWTFTSTDANWFGTDSFEVTVTDDLGGTTTQVVSITLANVDDAAVISGDVSFTGDEGDAVTGTMGATDVEGLTDSTYFTVTSAATNGSAVINAETGAWSFTPTDPNWFGSDSFTVTVTDDLGGTTTQLINITLANVDDAAVITGDVSFSGNEGDVVAGDLDATDVEGLTDTTYFTVSSGATNGTAAIHAETGAWTFTPTDPNWLGTDSFEVTVTDDLGGTTTQLVSITLANVDDAAVITGDIGFSGNEGDAVAGDLNATDVEGLTDSTYFTVSSGATNGTAVIDTETGAWSFTPTDANWFGTDSFEVTVTDDLGGTTTQLVNITLANVDDDAVITGDVSYSGNEGDVVAGDLDATDVEGLTDATYFTVSSGATSGTAMIDAETGAWIFTPTNPNWFGTDSFEVTVTDDLGGTTTQLISVTLANVDDAAVITGDLSFSGNEGDGVAGDLDATDVEGLTDTTYFTVSSAAANGTASIDAETGAWSFTPTDANWFGSDSFEVTVTDDLGGTTTQLVNITLANVDDDAVITGDVSYSGNEGDVVAGDLDATDVEGLTDTTYFTVSSGATNGTAAIHAETGAWTFTPTDANWFGTDSFEVTVTDDLGGTTTQLVNITLANVDDAAVITGDLSFSGNEGDAVAGDLHATDVDGLTDATYFTVSSGATNGTAAIDAETGAWTFTPTDANWFGSDSFEVTVTDDLGGTTTQLVNITLANVDDAAVITGDLSFSGNEGDGVAGDLDATDVEGLTDATYFTVSSGATNGTAAIHAETGAWTFTPTDANWFGTDSFEVTVTDDLGGTTTQLISVTLANVDDDAVITGDIGFSGNEGDAVAGDLNATDVEGLTDATYFTVSSGATNGTALIDAETGAWIFTPTNPNWFGTDSFEVTVTDDLGGTTTQLISITLANVDDAAVITGDLSFSGNEGDVVAGDLDATDVEDLTDATYFTVSSGATNGTAAIHAETGAWTFTPTDPNWFGSDSFEVTVTDDLGGITTQLISVTLANVDDATVITGNTSYTGNEGDVVAGDLNATDIEGLTDTTYFTVSSGATNGTAAIDAETGAWIFTPTDVNWFGADSFEVTVTDDLGGTTTQLVNITLANVGDAAVITGDVSFSGNEGDAVAGDLDATDIEGLTDGTYFSVSSGATNGTAAIHAETGAWSFTPTDPNWFGTDSFQVTVTDDLGGTTTQLVNITLANVDDAAIVTGDLSFSGNEGDVVAGDLNATDAEGLTDATYFTVSSGATNGTAAIDAETGAWTFTPTDANWFGSDSFEVTVTDDLGGTTTQLVNITLANVYDAAVITGDVSFSGNEGDLVSGDLDATDVEGLTDATYFSVSSGATNGTAMIDAETGAWIFTPTNPNWFGTDSFEVTVTDDLGGTTTQLISIMLANVDDAAVITGDLSFSGNEGDVVAGDLDATDVDGLTDATYFTVSSGATNGTATIHAETGAWTFTPTDPNWFGTDSFEVTVTDDLGGTTTQLISIMLANVGDAAVITGDVSFSGNEGDVVAGDLDATDVEGLTDATYFTVSSGATNGTAAIHAETGAWSFTPTDPNWFGTDSFEVTVTDDLGGTTTQLVSITLANVDDDAVITGDLSFSGNEGDVVAGDLDATDVEGLTDTTYFTVSSGATNGTATIHAETGAWSFTPTDPNWFGTDSFEVTATDDLGGTTTQLISITLANIDDAAVITGDLSFSGNEGDVVAGDLDATDVDGLTDATYFSVSSGATNGTAAIDAETGAWSFTPTDANWFGTESFEVTVTDDLGGTTTQLVSITLANVGDAAVITGDLTFSGNEGDVVAGDLNATDVEGLTDSTYFTVSSGATNGTAAIHAETGAWTFTPTDPNWFGSDSFEVTVTDDLGGTTTQLVSITLANVGDAAVITGDLSFSGNEGDVVAGDLDATDVEGLTDSTYFSVSSGATNGTAAIDAETGAWTFTPTDANWFGSDSFEVTVTDDLGGTTTQLVNITLANVDDAAVITGDLSFSGNEGNVVAGDLDATDIDGLTDATYFSVSSGATNGTAAIDAETGAWSFTPTDANWFGSDSFEVTVTDDLGGTTTQLVNITLANVDDAAVITGDLSFSGNEGDVVAGDLDATDVEGLTDATYFTVSSGATNGTAAIHAETGAWTFTPTDPNWFGSDSFEVTVTDDLGGTTTQLVNITLANVYDAAVITGDVSFSGNEGDLVSGDLNATDAEGLTDSTYFSVSSGATNGTALIDAETGAWIFTPTNPNWFGTDSFEVTVTDDLGGTTTQLVSVTLANVDDDAVITGDIGFSGNEGDVVAGDLDATDVEDLTDATYFTVSSGATNGTAAIHAETGAWSFTPTDPNWFGSDSFEITVTDDLGGTTTQLISITLGNVDDAAVITGDSSFSGNEGDTVAGDLDATDVDGLTDATYFTVSSGATNGSAAIDAETGAWSFTPTDPNWFGSDSFEITVTDDLGGTTTQLVSISLANVNDAPTFTTTNATPTFTENGGAVSLFSGTSIDAIEVGDLIERLELTVDGIADGSNEILIVDGQAIELTDLNSETTSANGYDISVSVSGSTATLVITQTGGFPTASTETLVDGLAYENSSEDPQGTARVVTLVSIKDDGGVANSGADTSSIAIASLVTISAVNDAPTATNDSASVNEGASVLINLTSNDLDPDNALDLTSITITSGPANGTLVDNDDGTFTYTHDGSETTTDSFSYDIKDVAGAASNTATVSLTIAPQNDAPLLGNNSLTLSEGGSVSLTAADLSASDAESDDSLLQFTVSGVSGGQFERVSDPGNPITTFSQAAVANGEIRFVHDGDENAPTYLVSASDGAATTGPISASIVFSNVNDAPTLDLDADDSTTVGTGFDASFLMSGGPVLIVDGDAILGDVDSDLVGLSVTITNLMDPGSEFLSADTTGTSIISNYDAGTGVLTLSGTDTAANYEQVLRTISYDNGSVPPDETTRVIVFVADDGLDLSNIVESQVEIVVPNFAPVATADSASVAEGESTVIDLAANDTDYEGTLDPTSIAIVTGPSRGALVLLGDGSVQYTHDGSETTSDSFSYTVLDADGAVSNTATVTITVDPQNDAPVSSDDVYSIDEDMMLDVDFGGGVVSNDFDIEGDMLSTTLLSAPSNAASFTLNADGSFSYMPAADFFGTDSFSYRVSDGAATSGISIVNLTVMPQNDAPRLMSNLGTTIVPGASDVITSSELEVADVDDAVADLSYSISTAPSFGHLELITTPGLPATSFTQADIDAGALSYHLDDPSGTADSFTFDVTDPSGAPLGLASFSISVYQAPLGIDLSDLPDDEASKESSNESPESAPEEFESLREPTEEVEETPSPEMNAPPIEAPNFLVETRVEILMQSITSRFDKTEFVQEAALAQDSPQDQLRIERVAPAPSQIEMTALNVENLAIESLDLSESDSSRSDATRSNEIDVWIARSERVVMAAGLGVVAALLRTGSLLALTASSVPLWKGLDPVAALLISDKRRERLADEARFIERIEDETDDVGRILDDDQSEDPAKDPIK